MACLAMSVMYSLSKQQDLKGHGSLKLIFSKHYNNLIMFLKFCSSPLCGHQNFQMPFCRWLLQLVYVVSWHEEVTLERNGDKRMYICDNYILCVVD